MSAGQGKDADHERTNKIKEKIAELVKELEAVKAQGKSIDLRPSGRNLEWTISYSTNK